MVGRAARDDRADEVVRLVRLTATHDPRPGDTNGALLVDADLAILAAPPDGYDRYAGQVRQEYRHLDDAVFVTGRSAVLRHLIDAPVLYHILPDREAMRTRARRNMRRELDRLGSL